MFIKSIIQFSLHFLSRNNSKTWIGSSYFCSRHYMTWGLWGWCSKLIILFPVRIFRLFKLLGVEDFQNSLFISFLFAFFPCFKSIILTSFFYWNCPRFTLINIIYLKFLRYWFFNNFFTFLFFHFFPCFINFYPSFLFSYSFCFSCFWSNAKIRYIITFS